MLKRSHRPKFMELEQKLLSEWKSQMSNGYLHFSAIQNIVSNNSIKELIVNRNVSQSIDYVYSNLVTPRPKSVTNQKSSGRCWIFAGLNMMRLPFMKKYELSDFEFSQAYIFFYYKLETANYFLNSILNLKENGHPIPSKADRILAHLLETPTCDGGQWDMLVSIIKKYGLVPKSAFQESKHSSSSGEMNDIISTCSQTCASKIWDDTLSRQDRLNIINSCMTSIYGKSS